MFHNYVTSSTGRRVDVDRAWYLMDEELLEEARRDADRLRDEGYELRRIELQRLGLPGADRLPFTAAQRAQDRLQTVWDCYCIRHHEKYGEHFTPDRCLSWDA